MTGAGDGFVLDDATITAYQLSDPKPFLSALLQRPYFNRVLLAPHLLGPASSGAVMDTPADLVGKMNSSWGLLARDGFCNGTDCFRLPVIAGESGSGSSRMSLSSVFYSWVHANNRQPHTGRRSFGVCLCGCCG